MTAISAKDQNLLMIIGVLVLYAFAALTYRKQTENWKIARKLYHSAQAKLASENQLIRERNDWDDRYETMQSLMPVFPVEKDVDTHWLNIMDSVAQNNHLSIARRQANKEVEVGDVFELPIDCKDWEGSLKSLIHFLWELNQKGAMLDVRQMFIRPSQRPGFLRGTFTLYCAYMRGEESNEAASAPIAESAKPAEPSAGAAKPAEDSTEASEPAKTAEPVGQAAKPASGESKKPAETNSVGKVPPAVPAAPAQSPGKLIKTKPAGNGLTLQ